MLEIITNNQPRPIVYGYELTPKERSEFDYLTDDGILDRSFIRYRGQVYSLDDWMHDATATWKGKVWYVRPNSFFSGVAIHFPDPRDMESVIVGLALSKG